MKSHDLWRTAVLMLAATGAVLPGSLLIAAGEAVTETVAVEKPAGEKPAAVQATSDRASESPVKQRMPASRKSEQAIHDVSLDETGALTGFVQDADGKAVVRTKVVVRIGRKTVAEALTDEKGRFEVSGLRGGVYHISHSHGGSVYRVWKSGTAPGAARTSALLLWEKPVIRAQGLEGTLGTLPTSTILATAGGVAGATLGIVGFSEANAANDRADAANAQLDALLNTP